MPPNRRSSSKTTGPAARGSQSTLSFGSRSKVTKPLPASQTKKQKTDASTTSLPIKESKAPSPSPALSPAPDAEADAKSESLTTAEVALAEQVEQEVQKPKSKAEEEAEKVSEAQIKRYWKGKEDERKAPRGIYLLTSLLLILPDLSVSVLRLISLF